MKLGKAREVARLLKIKNELDDQLHRMDGINQNMQNDIRVTIEHYAGNGHYNDIITHENGYSYLQLFRTFTKASLEDIDAKISEL